MADRDERRGLRDGNDRVPTIARWLAQKVPDSASVVELVLTAWSGEDEPEVLARYERERVHEGLAGELSALIDDAANDAGVHIKAQLAWVTAEGRPWSAKRFRGLCRKESQLAVQPLDGTATSQLTQSQRHLEALMETTMHERVRLDAARDREHERYMRLLDLAEKNIERLQTRIGELEEQIADLQDTTSEAVEAAEEAAQTAEQALNERDDAQSGDNDRLGKVIELVTKQLTPG
jgi:hypothetical protein